VLSSLSLHGESNYVYFTQARSFPIPDEPSFTLRRERAVGVLEAFGESGPF